MVCTAEAIMMNQAAGTGSWIFLCGCVLACSDAPQTTQESAAGESADALTSAAPVSEDDEDVDAADAAEDDAPEDPEYIVYFLPLTGTRLYKDVRGFLDTYKSLATNLPPHVSVTRFFFSSLAPLDAATVFRTATISVGTPFGAPPKVQHVHCRRVPVPNVKGAKNWLVDLHVEFTGSKWNQFRAAVDKAFAVPPSERRSVGGYHVTLFEARTTSVSKTTFASVCAAARTTFEPKVASKTYDNTPWATALFEQAGAGVVEVPATGFQVTK